MNKYLEATKLLNFNHPEIQKLIEERFWRTLDEKERTQQIYNFVRDEILFGYNERDDISASQVLEDGYGQCNTKATLLMALLRAVGIPNRLHGFTINKKLQKGAITGIWYKLSPRNILHSWVEICINEKWYFLEGVILDKPYLLCLQQKFLDRGEDFCGYGAYSENFGDPAVDWDLNHTFIQNKGINQDFGLFSNPDDFYRKHGQQLNPFKKWIFEYHVRHLMNRNVDNIRKSRRQHAV